MTVIVWDGQTLATDGAASDDACMWEAEKAWRLDSGEVVSGAGQVQTILEMRHWYTNGADRKRFPMSQLGRNFCHFLVVRQGGLYRYEQGPLPIFHGRRKCAFGEGKDFAYGALGMGADAATAAKIAIRYSPFCGMDVQLYTFAGV